MRFHLLLDVLIILILFVTKLFSQDRFSNDEWTVLKVAAGIYTTFKNYSEAIWPGYDLSRIPYVLYLPDKWALLLNAKNPIAGFQSYPDQWPDLGTPVYFHQGRYGNLIGQFEFNFQIDTIKSFAMGLPGELVFSSDNPAVYLFRTTIHEGFHQYQIGNFGEIPWEREERYPILDAENSALSALEMHILMDALKAENNGRYGDRDECLRQFVAVRNFRWRDPHSLVRKYEQGQEINEGTAQYVELKSMETFLKIDVNEINNPLVKELRNDFSRISMPDYLLEDMKGRLSGLAVSPENMARNRIYPVGAALGFLLDGLGIHWKRDFQAAGTEVSFPGILSTFFKLSQEQLVSYLEKARSNYQFPEILLQSGKLIDAYLKDFERSMEEFEHQNGIRIEIELLTNGLRQFRSKKEKTYVLEKGKRQFCPHYVLYSLKSENFNFEFRDAPLYEENRWQAHRKRVIFFSSDISTINLNGNSFPLEENITTRFDEIYLTGDHFKLEAKLNGTITRSGNVIQIELNG